MVYSIIHGRTLNVDNIFTRLDNINERVQVLLKRSKQLEQAIEQTMYALEEYANIEDWSESVADGGVTVDMVIKDELKRLANYLRFTLDD